MESTELHRSVGRIEGKLDTFIAQMKVQDERTSALEVRQDARTAKLEGRVGKVENRQHWYAGAGAIVGGLLAWAGNHLKIPIA